VIRALTSFIKHAPLGRYEHDTSFPHPLQESLVLIDGVCAIREWLKIPISPKHFACWLAALDLTVEAPSCLWRNGADSNFGVRASGRIPMNLSKSNSPRGSRTAKRIPLQICLTVTGRDEYGSAFVDQVLTENVSKDGGCLLLSRDLRRTQSLKIQGQNGTGFLAEVRWCMYHARRNTRRVGFQLDRNSRTGWIIGDPQEVA